jgi:tetratricopeptide (TPR) repeat protein
MAIASLDAQSRSEPDSAMRARLSAGDAAWSRGARDSAYDLYRAVVQGDSGASTRALFRLGLIEGYRNRLDDATELLRAYVRREPQDDEGRIALARVLAWDARYGESIAVYDDVLARDSTYRDAAVGRAQALAWSSHLPEAVASYRRWLAYAPADVEAWIGLAQTQRWSGRAMSADSALRRALQLAPSSTVAREQLRWVRVDLAGSAEPAVVYTDDSDGNRSTFYALTMASRSFGDLRLKLTGTVRETTLRLAEGTSTGSRSSVTWASPARHLAATVEVGAVYLSSRDAGEATRGQTLPHALARMSAMPLPRTIMGLTLSRTPFDETTPLIAGAISISAADLDLSAEPWRGVSLGASAGRATIDGGQIPNARVSAGGVVRWALRPGWSVAAGARGLRYDTTGRADGYFSPNRFSLLEVSARTVTGRDRGWGATVEGGVGRQSIRFLATDSRRSKGASRASAGVRFRPVPGYELEVAYSVSSVASPFAQQAAEYSARSFWVRGRLKL